MNDHLSSGDTAEARTRLAAPTRHPVHFDAGWDIAGNTNGGYSMRQIADVLTTASDGLALATMTTHFLAPIGHGEGELEVQTIRAGRRISVIRGVLYVDGRPSLAILAALGNPSSETTAPMLMAAGPPELPPVSECIPGSEGPGAPALMSRVQMRFHPDDVGFAIGAPTGEARIRGWFRPEPGVSFEANDLLIGLDAFPPVIFNAGLPIAWAPTLELTAHLRGIPDPDGWAAGVFTTRFVAGGFLEEDAELWSEDGILLAQSRQLALVPRG